ncbi:MerR family transcriptional regulator [Amycolatopsis sp. NPDC049252]|uniref:MerR family transcriptional regulator n=1 Tax=Amycolatopsis sp. NPDC049252 TaxID=3363933 RepID=UPI003722FBFD
MNVDATTGTGGAPTRAAWTPGKVAELLGVSPVTLRSWSARYRIGPATPEDGGHRRYSDLDVRRLQHMQRLIERGMGAREAAATAFPGPAETPAEVPVAQRVRELGDAAGELRFTSIAAIVDSALTALGAAGTWTEVVAPVLRNLGGRWLRGEPCFESEWALSQEVSGALQRFTAGREPMLPGRPVVLACCPGERHSLPVEFLRAALLEVGVPAVCLGQMVPAETTLGMVSKLEATTAVLWSISPSSADEPLARRLQRRGVTVCAAGPGWPREVVQGLPWVGDMTAALEFFTGQPGA